MSIALLLAVSEPLDALYAPLCTSARCEQLPLILAAISGVCGISGALIGTFGILHANQKRAWLENRLRTEAMRNFHFRTMFKL